MKATLSNSDYLHNFDRFISGLDFFSPEILYIHSHPKWINVHPAVLTLITAMAIRAGKKNVKGLLPNAPFGINFLLKTPRYECGASELSSIMIEA